MVDNNIFQIPLQTKRSPKFTKRVQINVNMSISKDRAIAYVAPASIRNLVLIVPAA